MAEILDLIGRSETIGSRALRVDSRDHGSGACRRPRTTSKVRSPIHGAGANLTAPFIQGMQHLDAWLIDPDVRVLTLEEHEGGRDPDENWNDIGDYLLRQPAGLPDLDGRRATSTVRAAILNSRSSRGKLFVRET
jgi:hypothetical protein